MPFNVTGPRGKETFVLRSSAASIIAVAFGLVCAPNIAAAQPPAKVYRVGWLATGSEPAGADRSVVDFKQGLRDLRYVDGKNVAIEYRYASGDASRLADNAAELVRLPVDVIVTSGEPAALTAKRATKTIPIVAMEFASDPVKAGLVTALGRPEGNVTGLATLSEDLWPKRLGLMKEVAPKISLIAVLWNPANPGNRSCVDEIKAAAPGVNMKVREVEVSDSDALTGAFARIEKDNADALAACWDNITLAHARTIADFALKRRLPTLMPLREYVQAGSLLSYGINLAAHRRRAAYYVDKIRNGVKPADLPVERQTNPELVFNATTAKSLGLALPPSLVVLADDVVE
jgi:putative ABC transport system substrate-binding protein